MIKCYGSHMSYMFKIKNISSLINESRAYTRCMGTPMSPAMVDKFLS